MTPQRDAIPGGPEDRIATGLGWFSIGLGLGELLAPGAMARLVGINDDKGNRALLRAYGLREIAAGAGILTQPRPAGWVWGRVAGDVLDIGSLVSAVVTSDNRGRAATALAAVLGVTALDLYCGDRLSRLPENNRAEKPSEPPAAVITIGRAADGLEEMWRDFARSRARSGESKVTGRLRFEPAPAGRGTIVKAHIDESAGGAMERIAGKVFGMAAAELMQQELRLFKQVVETGEIVSSDASVHTGMHAAQPSELVHA